METCLMNDFFIFFLRFVTLWTSGDKQLFKDLGFGGYNWGFKSGHKRTSFPAK